MKKWIERWWIVAHFKTQKDLSNGLKTTNGFHCLNPLAAFHPLVT
jgi:hypothetical protein